MSTFTVSQPLRDRRRKAAYTDTDTLQLPAPAGRKVPGSYTDTDVLSKGRPAAAGRPGSYADVHTMAGRKSAWGNQGRYTDMDRPGR